MVALQPNLTT